MRTSSAVLTLCLFIVGAPGEVFGQATEDERAAQTAAEAWLDLIDAGEYAESWNEAASSFQEAVSAKQWAQQVGDVRQPYGALQERTFESAESATDPPNDPPGEYVTLTYKSAFANTPNAIETVATVKQEDGSWKVAGYWVRPA